MAETLGVAASAVALTQACVAVINVTKDIKASSSIFEEYLTHLQELQSLSTRISQTSLLQTPEIKDLIDALLHTINNNRLASLPKGRLYLAVIGLYKRKELMDVFDKLERQKSVLSLAINVEQSKALGEIKNDNRAMSPRPNQSIYPQGITSTTTSGDQCTSLPGQSNGYTSTCSTGTYNNPFAGPGFNQKNGVVFSGSGPLLHELAKNGEKERQLQPFIYNRPVKSGLGGQLNGAEFEIEGDITNATLPDLSRHVFVNPQVVPGPSAGPGGISFGTQHNGIIIRHKQ